MIKNGIEVKTQYANLLSISTFTSFEHFLKLLVNK